MRDDEGRSPCGGRPSSRVLWALGRGAEGLRRRPFRWLNDGSAPVPALPTPVAGLFVLVTVTSSARPKGLEPPTF